jgi:hypothetical protein
MKHRLQTIAKEDAFDYARGHIALSIIIAKAKFMPAMNAAFYLLEVSSHLPDLHESILRKDLGEYVVTPEVTPL